MQMLKGFIKLFFFLKQANKFLPAPHATPAFPLAEHQKLRSPWLCVNTALQQLNNWCLITIIFTKNPKYSIIWTFMKKINSIPAQTMTVPLMILWFYDMWLCCTTVASKMTINKDSEESYAKTDAFLKQGKYFGGNPLLPCVLLHNFRVWSKAF